MKDCCLITYTHTYKDAHTHTNIYIYIYPLSFGDPRGNRNVLFMGYSREKQRS